MKFRKYKINSIVNISIRLNRFDRFNGKIIITDVNRNKYRPYDFYGEILETSNTGRYPLNSSILFTVREINKCLIND